jgi:hypothetical protein
MLSAGSVMRNGRSAVLLVLLAACGSQAAAETTPNPVTIAGQDLYDIQQSLPVWQKLHNYSSARLQHVVTYVSVRPVHSVAYQDGNVSPSVTTVYSIGETGRVSQSGDNPSGWAQFPGYYLAAISSVIAYRAANPPKQPVNFLDKDGPVVVYLYTPSSGGAYWIGIYESQNQERLRLRPAIGCGRNERYIISQGTYAVTTNVPCI